jgi:hypothetical protein
MQTKEKITQKITLIDDFENLSPRQRKLLWKKKNEAFRELESEIKALKKLIEQDLEEDDLEFYMDEGVKAVLMTRSGSIRYALIPEVEALDKSYLESYRSADSEYWKITSY